MEIKTLEELAKLIRYYILLSTATAGSGHPTSCLSSVELLTALFFKEKAGVDRFILSKGHAAPLLYAVYAAAGLITKKELLTLRKFGSALEGHPTPRFPYIDVATGSLGQGLSIGLGMALNNKYLDKISCRVFVLLGDGEMAEGNVWESIELASYYNLDNLIGIIDVNGQGQSGETMLKHDLGDYARRISAFGWQVKEIDGHNFKEILTGFAELKNSPAPKPKMIIARTVKGKGVSFLEDKKNWHGKTLNPDDFKKAVRELGSVNFSLQGEMQKPPKNKKTLKTTAGQMPELKLNYNPKEEIATRRAFGNVLVKIGENPRIVVLDGDVKNSTFTEIFAQKFPSRFFQMFIAEQNMVATALGLSEWGKIPFVVTFSAFLTRAFDQIRMAAISSANIKFVGSHAGVSIGQDGPSQMGLEDIAMFKTVFGSTILYPSDAVSTEKLVKAMAEKTGIVYLRTTKMPTPVIYNNDETFPVGGCKILKKSPHDKVTVIAAGITVHEALKAQGELEKEKVNIRIIDCYSVKPIDEKTLRTAGLETGKIITVEDHWFFGGLGDSVLNVFADNKKVSVCKLAVKQMPFSGKPLELLEEAGISAKKIVETVKKIV